MADTNLVTDTAYVAVPGDTKLFNQVSWGAAFVGVFLALAVQFLINLLGVGIGAAVLDPITNDNPDASTFSIGGGIWFVVSGIIASFIGGYVASRLSGRPSRSTGSYHGVTMWAVTTIVVLYMLTTSVGALVGGAFSGLGSVIGAVGNTAASAVSMRAARLRRLGAGRGRRLVGRCSRHQGDPVTQVTETLRRNSHVMWAVDRAPRHARCRELPEPRQDRRDAARTSEGPGHEPGPNRLPEPRWPGDLLGSLSGGGLGGLLGGSSSGSILSGGLGGFWTSSDRLDSATGRTPGSARDLTRRSTATSSRRRWVKTHLPS